MEKSELLSHDELRGLPVLVGPSGPIDGKELTTWNGSMSFFGALGVNSGYAILAAGTYLLRADAALDFKDQIKTMAGEVG